MILGISVYPNDTNTTKVKEYIEMCSKNGFKRVFMHILDIDNSNQKSKLKQLKEISNYAIDLGMETIVDVDRDIYRKLGIKEDNMEFFKKIGISTLRFDTGFNGETLAKLSRNKFNIKIEINASGFINLEDEISIHNPNKENISASHNFYPQKYTGLSYKLWKTQTKKLKQLGFKVSTFVTLEMHKKSIGAWNINDGMPTLEIHREMDLSLQVRHLLATNLCDSLVIANMFASKKQIKELGKMNFMKEHFEEIKFLDSINNNKIIFKIKQNVNNTNIENKILLFDKHIGRGDYSEYFLRSSFPRNVFHKENIQPRKSSRKFFEIGDILIGNNDFGKYKAEILIVTKRMKYDPRKNIVGTILREEHLLLKEISSWTHFKFIKENS